ncbi:peroxiredoxin [Bauldia litoralis]|uniref:Glutathione-dependent peroxiredoxin n=1 Tax=Bauldia litoralis TaxID=665467 RepID=A0A1G6C6Q4_9HYPH|nr:redoxin family protein [Bauldia litoralis]SDB28583.1 Peroxiredoxin [Bauldia litoralis]
MIKVGDRLPDGEFRVKNADGTTTDLTTAEYFGGRKVVLVGVPGAFTSTCHNAHIPQFVANAGALQAKGVDRIGVMATNDHHVMKAWSQSLDADGKVDFLADGLGDFTRAIGLEVDMVPGRLGKRCKRFAAVIDDGVVKVLNFEPDGAKGISATGAAAMIEALD